MPSTRQLIGALFFGIFVTLAFTLLAGLRVAASLFDVLDVLLLPGAWLATLVYGGLHGEEPILLAVLANALFYGALALVAVVLRSRFRAS